MTTQVDPKVAAWMARVIEAIGDLATFESTYGAFNLGTIPIEYEGDPNTDLAIGFDENGSSLTIHVELDPKETA